MKYGWDKIKVVTDGLNKWDDLQALTFDTCWYLLIWKWDDKYWTKWYPLVSDEVPCWLEWNCPICQEKITDIADLPGRPEPCSSWDAFLMMTRSWKLKVLCKENFECPDKYVAISDWDEQPWYLWDKLKVCNSNWPITLSERTSWSFHYMCIWFDQSKMNLKFTDLADTPDNYETPAIVVSNWDWLDYLKPKVCDYADFSYLIYNSKSNAWDSLCPRDMSVANWVLNSDYPITVAANATWSNHVQASADCTLRSTDDIKKWTWSTLFQLTRPWVYILTLNSTLMNDLDAWLKAARWWLTINWAELWDAKYCSRDWSVYVNDEYPWEYKDHDWTARELELWIMSFNTSYVYVFDNISVSNPANIWFAVKLDCRVWDPKHTWALPPNNAVTCKLTSWTSEEWPRTFISAVRVWDIPKTYGIR